MVKEKIIKKAKQTLYYWKKNWINKWSLERQKVLGWKSKLWEELKDFI